MKKSNKILGGVLTCVLALVLCGSLSLNIITLTKVNSIEKSTVKDDEARENGVTIVDKYEIVSTEQISDAYKSGDSSALSDKDKNTLKKAEKILDKIIKKGMTDYDKELAVYNWMYDNIKNDSELLVVVQDPDSDTYTPQGVLASKSAVCVGYATTFRMFMQMLGIDCMVVHESELCHTWDLVKIGSGWYHTDLYFDVTGAKYAHFNLTDEMREDDYSWDKEFYPATSSMEYCYAVKNAKKIDSFYSIPAIIKKAYEKKNSITSLKLSNPSAADKAAVSTMMDKLEQGLTDLPEYTENYLTYSNIANGSDYIILITIDFPNKNNNSEVDEKTVKKINKAIKKAFKGINTDYDYSPDDDGVSTYNAVE